MRTDPQIASRFPDIEIPRWLENEDFCGFLAGFERQLQLLKEAVERDGKTCCQLSWAANGRYAGGRMRRTLVLEFDSDPGEPPRRVEALRLHRDTKNPAEGDVGLTNSGPSDQGG